ncbi:unnamed protein product [Prunus brigantina]
MMVIMLALAMVVVTLGVMVGLIVRVVVLIVRVVVVAVGVVVVVETVVVGVMVLAMAVVVVVVVAIGRPNERLLFLLQQGLAFRGHNESEDSSNQGNFLELLQFLVDHNDEVRVVALKNVLQNLKVTSPKI